MTNKRYPNKLTVALENRLLELDLLSASLDRSFNYSDAARNVQGYSLTIDADKLSKEVIRDFEQVTESINKFFKVNLDIDGEQKEGSGKFSNSFSICGLTVDLELYS